ncbi:hypothetical protein CYMTET_27470 [Cymbomonas tetramitiformis]|uniref:Uncharacterized protein n=1 Tax=Cymbomonas tetramitiformis TaxID=36881 RepID=A0AAE0FPR3_9CHLO|nr:hypothetical protein CYMTET_27470 [Cymbomonas tetramitiformis]
MMHDLCTTNVAEASKSPMKRSTENSAANDTVCRLAMLTAYPTVEDLTMNSRGVYVCDEAEKHTLLLPVSRLETKVIIHRPPGNLYTPLTYGRG